MSLKKRIWDASFSLMLAGVSFNHLSVQEICNASSIHRSSFYRAFTDKFSLLEFGIDLLWHDYYQSLSLEALMTPFKTSTAFYAHSSAKHLITSQHADPAVLEDIKKITLNLLRSSYHHHLLNDDTFFYSGFICANIDYFDLWNQSLKLSTTPDELDARFYTLVLHPLAAYFE